MNDSISTLRSISKEIPDIEQIEFKKLFPVLLVKKRDELIFVVGDKGIERIKRYDNLPVLFKGTHQYKVRKTRFTTTFGIYINK